MNLTSFVPLPRLRLLAMAAVASLTLATTVPAQVLVDFGVDNVLDGNITTNVNPAASGLYWNNMTNIANGGAITNLITTNNLPSPVAVTMTSGGWSRNGIRNGGLLAPNPALLGIFAVPTVTQDYLFIQNAGSTGTLRIDGLNPTQTYSLSMFACRNGSSGTDVRNSVYTVTDVAGAHSVTLQTSGAGAGSAANPNGNDDTVVSLNALVPNLAGQLTLTLSIGPNGGNNFAYLNGLLISPTPSAPVFTLQPQAQTDREGTTNTLFAFTAGSQPVSYQWYFANAPVSGATSTNLVLAGVSAADAGNYYVVASNSVGMTTSAVVAVTIAAAHFPAAAVLVDFSPSDTAQGNPTTSPDANGHYWNNITGAFNVANGTAITNLVTANNAPNTVAVTITSGNWQANGVNNGGLLSPTNALLGDFAVPTATQDYFFLGQPQGTTATLRLSGLNPGLAYNLSMLASRNGTSSTDIRNTIYSVTDANGLHSVSAQSSGPGSGSAAYPNGNDDTVVSLNGLVPNASGQLDFVMTVGSHGGNAFAYLNALEITFTGPAPGFTVNPQSQTNVAGTALTLNSLATNTLPVSYQWYFASAPVAGANGADLVFNNVDATNAGSYFVVATSDLGSVTSAVAVVTVTNHAPVANNVSYSRGGLNNWKLKVSDLLANASDVDGHAISLVSVSTSTNGVTLVITPGSPAYVAYVNPSLVDDEFTYTVTDSYGATSSGVVTLTAGSVSGQGGQISNAAFTGGVASMTFAGIPGYQYHVQVSTNLSDWDDVLITNAPAGGVFQFTDNAAPTPTAFYRLMWNGN